MFLLPRPIAAAFGILYLLAVCCPPVTEAFCGTASTPCFRPRFHPSVGSIPDPKRRRSAAFALGTKRRMDLSPKATLQEDDSLGTDTANTNTNNNTNKKKNIVIAGGGIIGTSVAYYLFRDHCRSNDDDHETPVSLTLIDPTGRVGSCASGKAGGFLARDWRDGTLLQELQRYGFDLHQELADELAASVSVSADHPIDYRRLTCAAVAVDEVGDPDNDDSTMTKQKPRTPNKPPSKKLIDLEWVDPDVVLWGGVDTHDDDDDDDTSDGDDNNYNELTGGGAVVSMGDEETIAQVHPRKLCEAMWNQILETTGSSSSSNSKDSGDGDIAEGSSSSSEAQLVKGRIVRAITADPSPGADTNDEEKTMTGVELEDGSILPADVLVIACGPWTYEANQWFAAREDNDSSKDMADGYHLLPEITAIKCHSILVPSVDQDGGATTHSQAVFFDSNGAIGAEGDLEVYPRPDGDSYVNGFANEEGVCRERPGEERLEEDKLELLRSAMEFVETNRRNDGIGNNDDNDNDNDNDNETNPSKPRRRDHTQQVCYWPETPDGLPIIGKLPTIGGAYVAAGHSVWGILQGPATGKALAELIVTGRSECVDLAPFGLERFD